MWVPLAVASAVFSLILPPPKLNTQQTQVSNDASSSSASALVRGNSNQGTFLFWWGFFSGVGLASCLAVQIQQCRVIERCKAWYLEAYKDWKSKQQKQQKTEGDQQQITDSKDENSNISCGFEVMPLSSVPSIPLCVNQAQNDDAPQALKKIIVSPDNFPLTSSMHAVQITLPPNMQTTMNIAHGVELYYVLQGNGKLITMREKTEKDVEDGERKKNSADKKEDQVDEGTQQAKNQNDLVEILLGPGDTVLVPPWRPRSIVNQPSTPSLRGSGSRKQALIYLRISDGGRSNDTPGYDTATPITAHNESQGSSTPWMLASKEYGWENVSQWTTDWVQDNFSSVLWNNRNIQNNEDLKRGASTDRD